MLSQAKFAFNEERHAKEKNTCTKRKIKIFFFQEESKGWKSAWPNNRALIKWLNQTPYIMTQNAHIQQWERACTLTLQKLLDTLIQMESEVAMGYWPSLLTAETPNVHLLKLYSSPNLQKIIKASFNLDKCLITALVPKFMASQSYGIVQLVGMRHVE